MQDDLFAGLGVSSSSGYAVTCHMPHKTPFTTPVRGPVRPDKKLAKRAAALQICGLLHELGELGHDLKVKKKEVFVEDEDDEDMDEYNPNQRKMGTKKKRKFYPKEQPKQLKCKDEGPFFLHTVNLKLDEPNYNFKYALYHPELDSSSIGLITSTVLPNLGPFNLHLPSGLHLATISYSKQITLNSDQIRLTKLFHQYIFSSVLKITKFMEFGETDLLVTPLKNGNLDNILLGKCSEQNLT